ncbi:MAG TPA: hypothetical protein VGX25_06865 [Actinophytocola sp.]|uniref:hypothetical protein n=1 Tax=Actinophytocola sp. TaxID=1872138 RepID=UPI002DDCF1A5|nr:hypothetical protein [Actinophytocola sp.]HEV2779110.1 hypothetical protein [Actinophytocola sp.]
MASDDRQRLTELMDYSLAQQQLTWEEVAERAGKGGSVAQLRAVRRGRATLSVKTKLAIERGLAWPPGTVDGILANDPRVIAAIQSGALSPAEDGSRPKPLSEEWWEYLARELPEEYFWEVVEAAKVKFRAHVAKRLREITERDRHTQSRG